MKKYLFVTAIVLVVPFLLSAQKNKSIFFELGGNGLGISANFDTRFTKNENGIGFRAGIGIIPGINAVDQNGSGFGFSSPTILSVPVAINHLAGKGPHYFESGLGVTYMYTSGELQYVFVSTDIEGSAIIFIPSVGYRYAKKGKGFQGRVILTPFIGSGGVSFWGGISAGFKF